MTDKAPSEWVANSVVAALVAVFFGSLVLAYTESSYWLIVAVIVFCVVYAG